MLLDRGDFQVRVDLDVGRDQLAGRLQIREGRAKARDVLFHGRDTAPRAVGTSRPRRPAPARRFAGPPVTSSSTISIRGPAGRRCKRATAIGRLKRRGPALPGLSKTTLDRCWTLGRWEWPEMITSTPSAAGSAGSILKSWIT